LFTDSLAKSKGLICSAGFEGPSEAMFLGKKVLLSPISGQYEQAANAVCAEREGAMVFYQLNALAVDIFKVFSFQKILLKGHGRTTLKTL